MKILIQKTAEKRANKSVNIGYWAYGEGLMDMEIGEPYSIFRFVNSVGKNNLGIFYTSPVISAKNISDHQTEIETENSTYLITSLGEDEDYTQYLK